MDSLNNEEFDKKRKQERKRYLRKLPKYSRDDMESFAKYYLNEMDSFPPQSMDSIFSNWEDDTLL